MRRGASGSGTGGTVRDTWVVPDGARMSVRRLHPVWGISVSPGGGLPRGRPPRVPWRSAQRTPAGSVLALGAALPADAGLDEPVDVTVEDRRGVADLVLGAQVLDHLVRVQ